MSNIFEGKIRYPEARPFLADLVLDPEVIRELCDRGIPVAFDDEIEAVDALRFESRRIEFADHVSLGRLWIDSSAGVVRVDAGGQGVYVNTSITLFSEVVESVSAIAPELSGREPAGWEGDAERLISIVSTIDPPAAAPTTYWDSVRESISIGDWAEGD